MLLEESRSTKGGDVHAPSVPTERARRRLPGAPPQELPPKAAWGGAPGSRPDEPTYSLRNPGTSMSSSETRSLRMSVSSAETRGRDS